jgi:hypothetical protein
MRLHRDALIGLALLAAGSCGSDPTLTNRPPPEGGIVLPTTNDASETEGGEACPEGEPKLGDRCPPGFSEGNSCTYAVDMCIGPNGVSYVDYLTYCCLGSLWAACGGNSACDAFDAGPPKPVDASPPGGGDGGVDSAVDAAPSDAAAQDGGQNDTNADGSPQ